MKLAHNSEINIIKKTLELGFFDNAIYRGLIGEHFSDKKLGEIWDYLREFHSEYGKVPDFVTIGEHFPEDVKFLYKAIPVETPDYYAATILENYASAGVIDSIVSGANKLLPGNVVEGIENIRSSLAKYDIIRSGKIHHTLFSTKEERDDYYNREDVTGVYFGWPTLDNATRGAHGGQLIGFVARAGQGKTFSIIRNALEAWRNGYKVLMIATELSALDMLVRFDAMYLKCDYSMFRGSSLDILTYEKYKKFLYDTPKEDAERFVILDGYGMKPSEIGVLIEQHKPEIAFIDGVYLLESDTPYQKGQDWQKVRYMANELKHRVAKRYGIPVVFNTQFSRSVGTALGKSKKVEGGVEDIGYGDEFGKACDLLISLYRNEEDVPENRLGMKIIKGRDNADGLKWYVDTDFSKMTFDEIKYDFESQAAPFESWN